MTISKDQEKMEREEGRQTNVAPQQADPQEGRSSGDGVSGAGGRAWVGGSLVVGCPECPKYVGKCPYCHSPRPRIGGRVESLMIELTAAVREEIGALPVGVGTLGEEVERARAAARMSLQEVADRADLTKSHVWEIAKGRSRNPTIAAVAGLSRALGVPFLRLAQAALNTALCTSPTPTPQEARKG